MEFINLHLHSHFSNGITIPEVINTPEEYVARLKQDNVKAITFTEHGSVLSWVSKKKLANDNGMKYIHGIEAYITETLDEKIRDNYHLVLLAKNYDGVKEINQLVTNSFKGRNDKDDPRFHYVPRITQDEVFNTSDNVMVLTACIASPVWQFYKNNNIEQFTKWKEFIKNNNHRVWLEVQPHIHGEQIAYNKMLKELSQETGAKIVATNDVHALTKEDDRVRKILMKSKGINFDDMENDEFECWYKTYDEMVESFVKQGVFNETEARQYLDETVIITNMVEDFEFDYTFKYPKLFDNSKEVFKDLIKKGIETHGINQLEPRKQKIYKERILHEMKVYNEMDAIDYMLLMEYVISSAKKEGRFTGPARGSVSGSIVAYLLGITEIDSISEGLSFERFMNPERISLPDIDTDIGGVGEYSDRDWVVDFLLHNDKFNCSAIVTYNTLGIKGAIKDMGRALGYSSQEMNKLTNEIEDNIIPDPMRDRYPELVQLAEKVVGVITSIGRHAAGFVVTTRDIESELGGVLVNKSDSLVSTISMKEIDMLNYVKLDILGLDNIALINKTCELAGIERATPHSDYINFHDKDVMEDLRKSTIGIFQFEGHRAQKLVKDMFTPEVQDKIAKSGVNTSPVSQLALLNAAMRPGAASIIDDIVQGNVYDNGHPALNELLSDTLNYLVYQEDQIEFLVQMCGRTKGGADIIRRAIAKKEPKTLEVELPKVRQEFIETMTKVHGDTEEHATEIAENFIQIFQDAANYSFSKNHAIPYSYIGYISAWLRYYYPIEFLTAAFQVFRDDQEKIKRLTEYAIDKGIKVESPKFGYAKGDYFFNKETNTIYEGVGAIRDNNVQTGDLLYELPQKDFDSFTDFLMYVKDDFTIYTSDTEQTDETKALHWTDFKTLSEDEIKELDKKLRPILKGKDIKDFTIDKSIKLDRRKMLSLIRLGYFSKFGGNDKLEKVYEKFDKVNKPNLKTMATRRKKYFEILDYENSLEDEDASLFLQLTYELHYLKRCVTRNDTVSKKYIFVTEVGNVGRTRTSFTAHMIHYGTSTGFKIGATLWRNVPLEEGDLVEIKDYSVKPRITKVNGQWVDHPTDKEIWIKDYNRIRASEKGKL